MTLRRLFKGKGHPVYRKEERAREKTSRGFVWRAHQTYRRTSLLSCARTLYRGSQVKITRISRCPDSICPREGEAAGVAKIKSSFDRALCRDEEEEDGVAAERRDVKSKMRRRECVGVSRKVPLELFLPLFRRRCVHYRHRFVRPYVRRRFRVIGAITHPVFRQRTKAAAAVTASRYRRANSHSVGGPVYVVTSILRYGMLH